MNDTPIFDTIVSGMKKYTENENNNMKNFEAKITAPKSKQTLQNLWLMQLTAMLLHRFQLFLIVFFLQLSFIVHYFSFCSSIIYVFLLFNWRNASSTWCWRAYVCELVHSLLKASRYASNMHRGLKILKNMCGACSFAKVQNSARHYIYVFLFGL